MIRLPRVLLAAALALPAGPARAQSPPVNHGAVAAQMGLQGPAYRKYVADRQAADREARAEWVRSAPAREAAARTAAEQARTQAAQAALAVQARAQAVAEVAAVESIRVERERNALLAEQIRQETYWRNARLWQEQNRPRPQAGWRSNAPGTGLPGPSGYPVFPR